MWLFREVGVDGAESESCCIVVDVLWFVLYEGLRTRVVELAPPNMGILSKRVSGAAENVKISNFSLMFIGYVSFYCITVQIMQFPVLDFELDQYGSEPFI